MKLHTFIIQIFSKSAHADFLVPFVVEDETTKGTGWDFIVKLIIWLGVTISIIMAMKYFKSSGFMLLKNDYIEAILPFISGALCLFAAEYFRSLL
jgi:hypothetical protein